MDSFLDVEGLDLELFRLVRYKLEGKRGVFLVYKLGSVVYAGSGVNLAKAIYKVLLGQNPSLRGKVGDRLERVEFIEARDYRGMKAELCRIYAPRFNRYLNRNLYQGKRHLRLNDLPGFSGIDLDKRG
jgi:hypothetical protein